LDSQFRSDVDLNLDKISDHNDKINYEDFIDFENTGKSVEIPDEGLPATISVFSTITTMLSLIKRGIRFETNLDPIQQKQHQELRILSALMTILVRQVEVVAVVAESDDGFRDLKVHCRHLHVRI
jgi:hypothetical protein